METDAIIIFDNSSKEKILELLGIKTNEENELVELDGRIMTNTEQEPISLKDFGGILKGSRIAIKKDRDELVRYFVNRKV